MGRHAAPLNEDLDIRDFIPSERAPKHVAFVPYKDVWADPEDLKAQRHDFEYAQLQKKEA